jgi:hypothetical protein
MGRVHTVQDGEHLSAIATQYGFRSFIPIWNAPENARLRSVREDPHQLLPGDEIVVPEKQPAKPFVRKPGSSYTFVVYVEKLELRLRLLQLDGTAATSATGDLTVGGVTAPLAPDGEGIVKIRVPSDCTSATLRLGDSEYQLALGELAPVSERSGIAARLTNLGYWHGDDGDTTDTEAFDLAVELFRAHHGLDVSNRVDTEFGDALAAAHDNKTGKSDGSSAE